MKSFVAATSILLVVAHAAHAEGLTGAYAVSGVEPSGIPYATSGKISMTGNTTASITVDGPAGPYSGECMVTEALVACHADTGGGHFSIVVYDRLEDGVLRGKWTHSALRGLGEETLTPLR